MTTSPRPTRLSVTFGLIVVAGAGLFLARDKVRNWWRPRNSSEISTTGGTTPSSTGPTPRAEVALDPRRRQLIGVRTITVARDTLPSSIRTIGVVRAPETRLADVNVKIDGWIRQLDVDYTGQPVIK